ncbi:MAG: 3-methyl-2-oxobutanoate dehydrogenase subunit beta, partial [Acidobacteria bacterium]
RACSLAVEHLRAMGIRAALFRAISLYPFPSAALREAAGRAATVLVAELSAGQMIEDVRLALGGGRHVEFLGRTGGMMIPAEEIVERACAIREPAGGCHV